MVLVVATYHKSGTVWMLRLFQGVANSLGLKLHRSRQGYEPGADIYMAYKSVVPVELQDVDFRGVHLIRDPRDVILSGMHYHRTAREPWLKIPEDYLGGKSYQETLQGLSPDEQLYFEMDMVGQQTISQMLAWNYQDKRFFEVKYEDLISPDGVDLFHQIMTFMGFGGSELEQCLAVFRRISLQQVGFVKELNDRHVRSGRPRQWQTEFRRRHGERFVSRLGDCLVRLGYESDNRWVEQLAE